MGEGMKTKHIRQGSPRDNSRRVLHLPLATASNDDDDDKNGDDEAMSSIPQPVAGYLAQLVTFVQGFSTVQLVILALVNIPLFAIAINVLLQLVCISFVA